jgi:hypothetical protein
MQGKTQERMERGSRKRSSSSGSEKMEELVTDRKKWKESVRRSTGQSPQRALVPLEEEEEEGKKEKKNLRVFLPSVVIVVIRELCLKCTDDATVKCL